MKKLLSSLARYGSVCSNLAYAFFNLVTGVVVRSWWFCAVGGYYGVLAGARLWLLSAEKTPPHPTASAVTVRRRAGVLLVALSVCLAGINLLAALKDRGSVHHIIVMITIATYTFGKLASAVAGLIRAGASPSPVMEAGRNITFADGLVSVAVLQRSMLVSFEGMSESNIVLMNILTGTAVWLAVALLGINLIGGKTVNMAKSKIIETNEKIAEGVVGGYKKIEKGVVDGYKKIEKGVVDGYTKLEDKFVENYLTRDGESVEQAKARLKNKDK